VQLLVKKGILTLSRRTVQR